MNKQEKKNLQNNFCTCSTIRWNNEILKISKHSDTSHCIRRFFFVLLFCLFEKFAMFADYIWIDLCDPLIKSMYVWSVCTTQRGAFIELIGWLRAWMILWSRLLSDVWCKRMIGPSVRCKWLVDWSVQGELILKWGDFEYRPTSTVLQWEQLPYGVSFQLIRCCCCFLVSTNDKLALCYACVQN